MNPLQHPEAGPQWGASYSWYLRGWLPRSADAPILDLGCGSGRLLQHLKLRGYGNVRGVDAAPPAELADAGLSADIVTGDALVFLRQQSEAFELIVSIDLFEHLPLEQRPELLALCCRALRPGGRLVLQTPNPASPFSGEIHFGDPQHRELTSPSLLESWLRTADFRSVESREAGPIPFGYSVKSSVRYLMWQGVRAGLAALQAVETGSRGNRVWTRVYLMSAVK